MRKKRIRALGMLLAMCLLLSGCGSWKNYVYTDESLMREAAEALEDKYGEEFVIHDVWDKNQTMFYATCSPESNMDVVFQAEVYKDGRGLYSEEYLQGLITLQIRERFETKLAEVFGEDCFVIASFYGAILSTEELAEALGEETVTTDYLKNLTVEEYYELAKEPPRLGIRIIINKEELGFSEEQTLEEWDCLQKIIVGEPILDVGLRCHFLNENKLNESKTYFQGHCNTTSATFDEIIDGSSYFGFGFNAGIINKAYEEYNKVRMEIETNE